MHLLKCHRLKIVSDHARGVNPSQNFHRPLRERHRAGPCIPPASSSSTPLATTSFVRGKIDAVHRETGCARPPRKRLWTYAATATSPVPNSLGDTVIAVTVNRTLRTAAAVLLFTAIRASAHHSFAAEYDENKLITVSGSVSKFEWINRAVAVVTCMAPFGGSSQGVRVGAPLRQESPHEPTVGVFTTTGWSGVTRERISLVSSLGAPRSESAPRRCSTKASK